MGISEDFARKSLWKGSTALNVEQIYPFTDKLVPLYINCQCGRGFKYMTNMTDNMFDINCIECGSLVAVQYNAKKKIYETIREDEL